MRRARGWVAVTLVCGVLAPATGHARERKAAPPYTSASVGHACSPDVSLLCTSSATASRKSGSLALNVSITSPGTGLAPGLGVGYSLARFRADIRIAEPTYAIPVNTTLEISSARARRAGSQFGQGFAYVFAYMTAEHRKCTRGRCVSSMQPAFALILNGDVWPYAISKRTIPLGLTYLFCRTDRGRRTIEPIVGTLTVKLDLYAIASIQGSLDDLGLPLPPLPPGAQAVPRPRPDTGTAAAKVNGVVAKLTTGGGGGLFGFFNC